MVIRNLNWDYIWLLWESQGETTVSITSVFSPWHCVWQMAMKCMIQLQCKEMWNMTHNWPNIEEIRFKVFVVLVWLQHVHEHPISGSSGRTLAYVQWSIITGDNVFSCPVSHTCESSNSSGTAWDTIFLVPSPQRFLCPHLLLLCRILMQIPDLFLNLSKWHSLHLDWNLIWPPPPPPLPITCVMVFCESIFWGGGCLYNLLVPTEYLDCGEGDTKGH